MDQANQQEIVIVPGADVVSVDEAKVGTVREVYPDYIVVAKGIFFPSDHYIPASAISDATEDTVHLSVSKDEALQQGWESPPTAAADATATPGVTNRGTVTDTDVAGTTGVAGQTTTSDQPFPHTGDEGTHIDANEAIRVPLAEEELTATKRPVEQGQVRVTKDVEETEQTLDVPVRQEQVNVERRVVDRDVAPGDTTFQEGTIEVPVRGEEVDVQKRARVGEELEISKNVTQETQQVSDTVRRERAHVENVTGTENVTGVGTDNVTGTTDTTDESLLDQTQDNVDDVTRKRRRR